jgi:peptidyl-prolyl cis-trans isomerase SurA
MWGRRLDADVYTCDDINVAKKVRKMLKKKAKKGYTTAHIVKTINEEGKVLTITSQKYLENEDELINSIAWSPGVTENMEIDGKIVLVSVNAVLNPMPKTLMEAKGLVTADYQTYLEKEWIEMLKKKYSIEIDNDVLSSIR